MQVAYPALMAKPPAYTGPRFQRRKHWLGVLVAEHGGPKAVAAVIESVDTYITAMCKGKRGVGDEIADRLERKFGKPEGWLDRPLSDMAEKQPTSALPAMPDLREQLAAAAASLPQDVRESTGDMLRSYLANPTANEDLLPIITRRLSGEFSAPREAAPKQGAKRA